MPPIPIDDSEPLDEVVMQYLMLSAERDTIESAQEMFKRWDMYQRILKRVGEEHGHKMIDDAEQTLQLVGVKIRDNPFHKPLDQPASSRRGPFII